MKWVFVVLDQKKVPLAYASNSAGAHAELLGLDNVPEGTRAACTGL